MRIAFACPSYGPIDPKVVHAQRHAIMMAWANGIEVHGDLWIDRAGWDVARNQLVDSFLKDGSLDGIFWCDSDVVLTPEAIVLLVAPKVDVCTGVYFGRHPPFEPQIHVFNEEAQAFNRILKWPEKDIFPVHGHGFGCCYTSRKALELTQQVTWDGPPAICKETKEVIPVERKWWFKTDRYGEDLTWGCNARARGLVLWCNPNVVVGHLGMTEEIGPAHFKKWFEEHSTGTEDVAMALNRKEDGGYETALVAKSAVAPGTSHEVGLEEHLRMTPSA
jgi:hypothetical protein